jgi:hypothetical protein
MPEFCKKHLIQYLVEPDGSGAVIVGLDDAAGSDIASLGITEGVVFAYMLLLGFCDHDVPAVVEILLQEKKLHAAARFAYGVHASFSYLAVVYNQNTSFLNIRGKVGHLFIDYGSSLLVEHQ